MPSAGTDESRHTLVPRQAFAHHHRLTGEENRRSIQIDRLLCAPHAIAVRVERVSDRSCALHPVRDAIGHECRSKARIDPPARLLACRFLLGRVHVQLVQDQLARRERQHDRTDGVDHEQRISTDEASDPRSHDEQHHQSDRGGRDTAEQLDCLVRLSRHEERRKEMLVEPLLIRDRRPRDERRADEREHELSEDSWQMADVAIPLATR